MKDSRESKSIEINKEMKILTVAFMLLFSYLDTLPKLNHIALSSLDP